MSDALREAAERLTELVPDEDLRARVWTKLLQPENEEERLSYFQNTDEVVTAGLLSLAGTAFSPPVPLLAEASSPSWGSYAFCILMPTWPDFADGTKVPTAQSLALDSSGGCRSSAGI